MLGAELAQSRLLWSRSHASADRKVCLEALVTGVRQAWQEEIAARWRSNPLKPTSLFQESIDHRGQSVPVEVPLLDYAGFKLNALLLSTQPDRQQVADTAQEASTWWTAIGPRITDKTLETPWLAYPSTLKVSGDPMRCPKRC